MNFHRTLPGYTPTPLLSLEALAKYIDVADIHVKDESHRFGLNSFKVLGSSYAIGNYLNKTAQPRCTFATATDGNHGLGVAWTAKLFEQKAVVYMPKGSSEYRLSKIRELGAEAAITQFNYDDTVRYVSALAQKNGWILVQDTAWENYKDIPLLIMKGYLTLLGECMEEKVSPTHVFLQAGVGSFAAAIADGLVQLMDESITFIVVEPTQADCLFQSACSATGMPTNTRGDLSTIMAGLSCGEPNPIAWEILKNVIDYFITCSDDVAAKGMRIFGNPLGRDPRIISGESGAVPLGLLVEICRNPLFKDLKDALKLNSKSRILLINTEGDTDPHSYRAICWD